jgi:hypothetical protein
MPYLGRGYFSSHIGFLRTSMFYIIGLGLCDEKDITLRGLEASIRLIIDICGLTSQALTRL